MFEALIKAIQGDVTPESLGDGYWSKPIFLSPADPEPEAISISTLTGLIDYINQDVDLEGENCHVQVVHPTMVQVCNTLSSQHRQRETLLISHCGDFIGKGFPFGQWLDTEQFIIALQAQFVRTDVRDQVLSIVGSIIDEDVRETSDDGVTQNVTTRAGIARKADTEIPNPVILQPYRTFPEIEQPASPFVLRLRRDRGVQAALFEAGGGAWKCEAVLAIAAYLKSELQDGVQVLA